MRQTKAIYLAFNNTSATTATINIPFKVSSIHTKALGFDTGTVPTNPTYGIITSDLTDNQPIGMFYNDSTYSYNAFGDVVNDLFTPRTISGTYNFYMSAIDGTPYVPIGADTDKIVLILEFNEQPDNK